MMRPSGSVEIMLYRNAAVLGVNSLLGKHIAELQDSGGALSDKPCEFW
jgi:hypothetical protein